MPAVDVDVDVDVVLLFDCDCLNKFVKFAIDAEAAEDAAIFPSNRNSSKNIPRRTMNW